MNILHSESGQNWGGQEFRTFTEVRWLNANGHKAWLACDPRGESFRRGTVERLPIVGVKMHGSLDPAATCALARCCRENRIDVIHNHGPRDSWISYPLYLAGIPVLRSRQITVPVRPGFRRTFVYKYGCYKVIAASEVIRQSLVRDNGIAPEHIAVVGEGVDLKTFRPDVSGQKFRAEFFIPDGAPLFGIVGMMRGEKGHDIFLKAALEVLRTHPHARFVLVGEGVGGRRIERECREKIDTAFGGGNSDAPIKMTGYRNDIAEVMAALDVLVVPSLAEAQSLVVPQAFATGCAVIASNVGGLPELVRHEVNGLLVPPGQSEALAAAMRRMIDDPALRKRLAQAGLETARQKLSFDLKMEETLALYRAAANACAGRQTFAGSLWRAGLFTVAALL
jgi:glycosyltransferase involved in cell wall biosynthesis